MLKNSNGQHLQLLSTDSYDEILRIEKSGDYGIDEVAFNGRFIAYSDCKETQIFSFDKEQLKLRKLTRKVCSQAGIRKLPSAAFLAIKPTEDGQAEQLILVTKDLVVCTIDLKTCEITQVCNKSTFEQGQTEMRDYDKIVTGAHFNPVSNRLVLAFASSKYFSVIDLGVKNTLYWRLPSLTNQGIPLVFSSDVDKLLVGYDSNRLAIFDLLNRQVHPWTNKNLNAMPKNFLNRYNKFVGAIQLNEHKYILYTSYTFCVLDLTAMVPEAVEMVQNHPSKTSEGKQLVAETWFDNLKLS